MTTVHPAHILSPSAPLTESARYLKSPLRGRSVISKTIGYIKTNVSKEIHQLYGNVTVWQRGFHDHVIRDLKDYEKISNYIFDNPRKWQQDCLYSEEE